MALVENDWERLAGSGRPAACHSRRVWFTMLKTQKASHEVCTKMVSWLVTWPVLAGNQG